MGRKVIKKEVVYHKEDGSQETTFEFISDQKLRDKGAIPRRNDSGNLAWHIYTGKRKTTLIDYLNVHNVNYKMVSGIFSSTKMYYRRNDNPNGLLLVEAIKVCDVLGITLDKFVNDLKKDEIL